MAIKEEFQLLVDATTDYMIAANVRELKDTDEKALQEALIRARKFLKESK